MIAFRLMHPHRILPGISHIATVAFFVAFCLCASPLAAQENPVTYKDALQLYKDNKWEAASEAFAQLLDTDPEHGAYNYYYGMAQLNGTSDRTHAWSYLNKGRKMADTQPNFYYDLGRAYHLGYEFMKAMEAYQRFLGTSENEELNAKATKALEDCLPVWSW